MSQQHRSLHAVSLKLTAAVAYATAITGLGALPAAGGRALGIARSSGAVGDTVPVDTIGSFVCTAGAAFAADTLLMTNASGQLIPWTTGNTAVARALEAATGLGDLVEVLWIVN